MADAYFRVEELIDHAAFVRSLARALTRDEHAAEDVCQETWRAALLRPPMRGREALPWLAGVVRRIVSRRRRDQTRREGREVRAARPESLPPAASIVEREDSLRTIVEAVLALPEPYRATILLRFYENQPPREIARRMHVAVDTVHTRVRRALAMLRERLASQRLDRGALLALAVPRIGDGWLGSFSSSVGIAMKAKTIVVVCALAVVGAGVGTMLWFDASTTSSRASGASASPTLENGVATRDGAVDSSDGSDAEARDVASRSIVAAAADERPAVSGRVIDTSGNPVANARVRVGAAEDPFGPECAAPKSSWDNWSGRYFATDSEGRYRAVPDRSRHVQVAVASFASSALQGNEFAYCEPVSDAREELWVDVPAENVDFVVRVIPTATVTVRAEHAGSRAPLDRFNVGFGSATTGAAHTWIWAQEGVAKGVFPVRSASGDRYVARLSQPKTREPVEAEFVLTPKAEIQVVLVVPSEGRVSGYVVDESGHGIEGAVVFLGDTTDARGDEPFKPFDTRRVSGGAKSGADGWFELEGDGPLVSAWHADFSDATLERAKAGRIVLGARATVSGRLLDANGAPAAERSLVLGARKGGASATSDVLGRFRFERVEAGAHGVWLDGKLLAGIRVAAGEDVDVELSLDSERARFELSLLREGAPIEPEHVDGILVGIERVFGLFGVQHGEIEGHVGPGRYFLATRAGDVAECELDGVRATVELGGARLVVRAEPGRKVHAVPAHMDRFTRLVAARLPIVVPESGELVFLGQPGRYALVGNAGSLIKEVEVGPEGATVDLR